MTCPVPSNGNLPGTAITFTYGPVGHPTTTVVTTNDGGQSVPPFPQGTAYQLDAQGQATAIDDARGHRTTYRYDADHDVTGWTDANGHTTTYAYQYVGPETGLGVASTGLLTQTVAPASGGSGAAVTTDQYDPLMYDLIAVDGPGGHRRSAYVRHAVMTATVQLAAGRWTGRVWGYAATGAPTRRTDGRALTVGGDGDPASVQVDPALAPAYTQNWDDDATTGDLLRARTPAITTTAGADLPATTQYGYDQDGNPITTTTPNGDTVLQRYDGLGRVVSQSRLGVALAAAPHPLTTGLGYDGDGNVASVTDATDATGATTRYDSDGLGRVLRTRDALGATTLYTYTALLLSARQDAAGHVTQYASDDGSRLSAVTDPLGAVTAYGYDAVGNTTVITTPLSYPAPPPAGSGDGSPATASATALPLAVETRGYDARDQLISDRIASVTGAGASGSEATGAATTLYQYDAAGRPTLWQTVRADGRLGAAGGAAYDLAGQLTTSTVYPADTAPAAGTPPPPAARQQLSYDAAGNLRAVDDYTARVHTTTVDGAGRPVAWQDRATCAGCEAAALTTSASYDPRGNLRGLSRQTESTEQGPSGLDAARYQARYNAAGWLLRADDGAGATAYGYDAAGRVRTVTRRGGAAEGLVTAERDAGGAVTRLTDALSETVQLTPSPSPAPTPDAAPGPVTTATATATPTPTVTCASIRTIAPPAPTVTTLGPLTSTSTSCFTYTAGGWPQDDQLANGVTAQRSYDAAQRLQGLSVRNNHWGDARLYARLFTYVYSPQGRLQASSDTIGRDNGSSTTTRVLGYDAQGELSSAADGALGQTFGWSYDANGNLRREDFSGGLKQPTLYAYANADGSEPAGWLSNELVATTYLTAERDYAYDGSGDTTALTTTDHIVGAPAPSWTHLSYDAQGHVTAASLSDGTEVRQGYTARGLRDTLSVSVPGEPSYTERLRYQGAVVSQVSASGPLTFTEAFLYRPDGSPLELLYQEPGQATARYWYLVDGQGSVVALTDATGQVVNQYGYDVWGRMDNAPWQAGSAEGVPQPLRYRGYWYDGWYGGVRTLGTATTLIPSAVMGAAEGERVAGAPLAAGVQAALTRLAAQVRPRVSLLPAPGVLGRLGRSPLARSGALLRPASGPLRQGAGTRRDSLLPGLSREVQRLRALINGGPRGLRQLVTVGPQGLKKGKRLFGVLGGCGNWSPWGHKGCSWACEAPCGCRAWARPRR